MERKIGEIFNYQDNWYQCIEDTGYGCIICHFNTHDNICCNNVLNIIGNCLPPYRKDYKSVVFRKLLFKGISYPIIALVEDTAKEETIYGYNEKGKVMIEDDATYKDDLMMLPQKKEGWIIIHKEAIYDKETAEKIARETTANVIRIQKIEWEE